MVCFFQITYLSSARPELQVSGIGDSSMVFNSNHVKMEMGENVHFDSSSSNQQGVFDLKVHTEDDSLKNKPFPCPICGKRFGRFSHVQRHQSVHTGDKPFQCDVCQERFTRIENRERHMASHLDVCIPIL